MAEQLSQAAIKAMNQLAAEAEEKFATRNCETFLEAHPEFWCCKENLTTVTDWLLSNTLRPTVENFEKAFRYLTNSGLLLEQADVDKRKAAATTKKVWTAKQVDDLSSSEYKRMLTDPDFKAQVDAMPAQTYAFGQIARAPDRRG